MDSRRFICLSNLPTFKFTKVNNGRSRGGKTNINNNNDGGDDLGGGSTFNNNNVQGDTFLTLF